VRIRISSVPVQNIQANALVDPDQLVAEINEQNNDLRVTLATESTATEPPTLADEGVWNHAGG
jgi:subtilase family serine protease